jgi:predicted DNA-binding protein (UPF0251 family)
MRQIREILRLRLGLKLTQREVGLATNVSPATVWDVVTRMQAAGFTCAIAVQGKVVVTVRPGYFEPLSL